MAIAKDKFSHITDIRQRAVARRVARILDLFSTGFAKMAPEERLAAFLRADDDAARWRNLVRIPALGMVQRLGRDLGLAIPDLHGETASGLALREEREKALAADRARYAELVTKAIDAKLSRAEKREMDRLSPENRPRGCTIGRTQIPELAHVQRTTAVMACAMFDAMLADKSDACQFIKAHYEAILVEAKAEVGEAIAAEDAAKRKRRAA